VSRSLALVRPWIGSGHRRPLALAAEVRSPRVKAGDLRGIDGVIAKFSTSLGRSSRNRIHNVATAAHALDGWAVLPGETFSYNRVVGPRTTEAGYRTAPVLKDGELVPGTGGGACQVSSTLYNVALLSNMRIARRSHHSRPVHYVRPGRDATVVYGALDLVFRNGTGSPLVIRAEVARGRLWIKALGRLPAPAVRIETAAGGIAAPKAVERPDPALAPGQRVVEHKAQRGVRVTVTRVVGEGAEATREVISSDVYRPQSAVIRVGPAPVPPEQTPPITPAEAQPTAPAPTADSPQKSPKIGE
jgi:vancomycin resistance protein YoaR